MAFTGVHQGSSAVVPAIRAAGVTPSDSTELVATRALYVGTGGDLTLTFVDGDDATFVGVPSGSILPVQCVKVKAATTADDIVALY